MAQTTFDLHELTLTRELAEVHAFDLTGDGRKELIVIEADKTQRQIAHFVRVFLHQDDGFLPIPGAEAQLPPEVAVTGVGMFSGVPGLAMILPREVVVWSWRDGQFQPKTTANKATDTLFAQAGGSLKRGIPWIVDLNDDSNHELAVPVSTGFELFTHQENRLQPMVDFSLRPKSRVWDSLHRRLLAVELPTVVFPEGATHKHMLVFSDGMVNVFPLGAAGRNQPALRLDFQPPKPFDPKGPEDPPLRLVMAKDLDQDGLFDLVFAKNSATDSTFRTSTRILVHYGQNRESGESGEKAKNSALPHFNLKPDQVFVSEGFTFPIFLDLNSDQRTDMVLVNVEVGFWNAVKAFIARSVTAQAAFYLMPAQGRFTQQPNKLVDYTVTFTLGRDTHKPLAVFGDFNGDGRPDLLLSKDKETLGLHWGQPDGLWQGDPDAKITGAFPVHQRDMLVEDLDGDGRDDLILRLGRRDYRQMPEMNGKFAVMMSRFPFPKRKVAQHHPTDYQSVP